MGLFKTRQSYQDNKTGVPVWFMRQAGRYHQHYQELKKTYDFMTLCKDSNLAKEVTMGPMDCFHFDAAILFSDLLFPLEHLGLGLTYNPGPILDRTIATHDMIQNLKPIKSSQDFYKFQRDAVHLLKQCLPASKTLLGFTGAPFTLYAYAIEGGHSGNLTESKKGLYDGRFDAFMEKLVPIIIENLTEQAEGGADALCLFDTAVGELTLSDFKDFGLKYLRVITKEFKKKFPDKAIIYYSKWTSMTYLREIQDDCIDVLGVDWRVPLGQALNELGKDYYIQGNLDPSYLHLPWNVLEQKWLALWQDLNNQNCPLDRWIAGLGHGVLQHTPEENVANSVKLIHEKFRY